jgi:hypothetical protein
LLHAEQEVKFKYALGKEMFYYSFCCQEEHGHMRHLARTVVRSISPPLYQKIKKLRLLYLLGDRADSYLLTSGFMKSHELGHPCKQDGAPLPWMNYAIIAFLGERLQKDMTLFEYGSGYSTLFYSRLVKRVVSVEHDKAWYEAVRTMAGPNVHLLYQPLDDDGEYCRLINQQNEKFDVVVIDGRDRVRCAINSYESLSKNGVVVMDDSEREKYSNGSRFYLAKGFKKIEFAGLKFKGFGSGRTAIFYRSNNCLGI